MKMLFIYLLIVMNICLWGQDLIEEQGYYSSPKAAIDGIVYSDNYFSKLYYSSGQNAVELFSSPGCGRYFSLSPDKRYIGLKIIYNDGSQQPVMYDLKEMKMIKMYQPVSNSGQVSFGRNLISFSDGNSIVIYNGVNYRHIDIGNYSNITPLSPDDKYVIFNDGNDQLWILNLSDLSKKMITNGTNGYYNPQWSPDGLSIVYSSLGGDLKVYSLSTGETFEIGSGYSPSWSDDSKTIVYYKKNIENMTLLNSDLYEYLVADKESHQLTFTKDIFEMDPSYKGKDLIFHTREKRQIKIITHSGLSKSAAETNLTINNSPTIAFYTVPDKTSSMLDMPYIHQVYDTPNWFNGHSACGPTAAMNVLAYYNILPVWETNCSSPKPHINNWGRYVAEKYNFKAVSYNFSTADPNGKASYGGYGYMWNGSKSPHSTMVNYYKNHGVSASLSDYASHSEAVKEIQDGFPYTMCVGLTSAGHIIAAHGLGSESHTLIVNDPYGNKNTPGYPSYDGKDARYDWPGYNNGFQNLSTVYWCVKTHGNFPVIQDSIVDDIDFSNGFYLNTKAPASMSVWKDMNKGFNEHMWYTITRSGPAEVCYATWKPTILKEGKYELSAYIALSNAEAATYIIKHRMGTDTLIINQKSTSNDWLTLGSYWFEKGTSNMIKLSDVSPVTDQEITFDAIRYKLVDTIFTHVNSEKSTSQSFSLYQNFPNPFNPSTNITFSIPEDIQSVHVNITIYNVIGEKVTVLLNDFISPGKHTVTFNASGLAGGVYYCSLTAGSYRTTNKMILMP